MTEIILISIAVIVLTFIFLVIIRAVNFKPINTVEYNNETFDFDRDRSLETLRELIKCKTVSYKDRALEDKTEFDKLVSLLSRLYPNVYKVVTEIPIKNRGVLLRWQGESSEKASVMMSHYDVVPVNEELWEYPPFSATVKDGVLWGRGAVDTKITLNGCLSATDYLISKGFTPKFDVYFAFSGEEEINGLFASEVVDYFSQNNIKLDLVLDEGGAVVENVFPGVKKPCGMIGIAEKGMVDVLYRAKSSGGHASQPKPHTPVGVLSKACVNVEKKPFKMKFTKPVKYMFDTLGRNSTFGYKIIFANLWCFGWILDILGKKSGGEINALLRTTVAFTQMKGSSAPNVIPPECEMVSNVRINPSETVDSVILELTKKVNDNSVEIIKTNGNNPSRISRVDCDAYRKVANAVASTFKGAIVSPYLMVQCSDSRHYGKISDRVYRFSASDLNSEERLSIHANNERIRVDAVNSAVEFYIRLIKNC